MIRVGSIVLRVDDLPDADYVILADPEATASAWWTSTRPKHRAALAGVRECPLSAGYDAVVSLWRRIRGYVRRLILRSTSMYD